MAFHLAVTMEKPVDHLAISDWKYRVERIRNVGNARQFDALDIRNTSRMLRNESRIESFWANYQTNEALTVRAAELHYWRDLIAKTFERLELEIAALEKEKIAAEAEIEAQARPLMVVAEILSIRDSRLIPETTHDEADTEIKNELYILETNQRLLADRCQRAWEKLRRLEDVHFKISQELKNKSDTEDLERAQLALDANSGHISFKPDALRNPRNCVSYNLWLGHTKNMKELVENELADTAAIKETLFVCRDKARRLLEGQQERTAHILRKRIFQTQQAANELEWQQLKMKDGLKETMCEIQSLEDALHEKTNILKLAETRLENRSMRCPTELCLDEPHSFLCNEVEKLREIRLCLQNKLDEAKANYNLLSDHQQKIDEDLENKLHSLKTDSRALELHKSLKEGELAIIKEYNPCEQTDRNIELTHTEQDPRK